MILVKRPCGEDNNDDDNDEDKYEDKDNDINDDDNHNDIDGEDEDDGGGGGDIDGDPFFASIIFRQDTLPLPGEFVGLPGINANETIMLKNLKGEEWRIRVRLDTTYRKSERYILSAGMLDLCEVMIYWLVMNALSSLSEMKKKSRKPMPTRFNISRSYVEKDHPPPIINFVTSNPSSSCLSLQREKSPTKVFKTQVPSSPAMIQALEVQSSLGSEFRSCIKTMVKSQVSSGFWMGLPIHFCKAFLPKQDATFVLEDEEGKYLEVKYIAKKLGLSAGWKNFAMGHNLTVGDVLLFHLIKTTKFKVYIFKANDSRQVDGARALLDLDAHTEELTPGNDVETVTLSPETQNNKHPESLSLTVVQKKRKRSAASSRSVPPSRPSGHFIEQSGNESEEVGSEVLEVYKPFKPKLSFREVKTFADFHIVVKGLCIDHELPDDVRFGYYKLCFYRKQFLHHGLREDMYDKLVVGIIGEIVSIANKMKNCKFTTTKKEFEEWDKSLKIFELMGMKVDFLLDKMNTLARLLFESEGAADMKKYLKAKIKQEHIEEEIKMVAAKLKELKESAKKADGISGFLKQKVEKFEYRLKKEVDAPW